MSSAFAIALMGVELCLEGWLLGSCDSELDAWMQAEKARRQDLRSRCVEDPKAAKALVRLLREDVRSWGSFLRFLPAELQNERAMIETVAVAQQQAELELHRAELILATHGGRAA